MTNYLDKEGLKKFWDITKGKYSVQGHTHDDRYLKIGATAADSNKLGGYASSSYARTITIGIKRDYQDIVLLLWKDDVRNQCYANGLLYTSYGASMRGQYADIRLRFSRWGDGSLYDYHYQFNAYGVGTRMKLVTCTYEGEKWWAIQHTNVQATIFHFTNEGSYNISWKFIVYYNQDTKQVLNQEIYDSIVDQSDKLSTFYVGDAKNALMTDLANYLPLSGGTLSGMLTANGGITLPLNKHITQNQASSPNYTTMLEWLKGGASRAKYNPQIGQLNTEDAITILPYPIDDAPWNGKYGLFVKKGVAKIDGVELSKVTHNHDSKYLSLSGGTLTGGLTTNGTFHSVGASTLDSTLTVGGAATLNSSLTVKGATTVQGLTANGATSVQDLTVNGVLTTKGNGLELYHAMPFIDFHYGNSSDDYNVRIWNNVSGGLQINAHKLIDLVGPMKSSGGRLWITNGDTNIYDVKTTGLTSYVPVVHQQTSQFVGNVGIGTDADAAYKLKVNGDTNIQTLRGARWIEADLDQGLVIGNSSNDSHVGVCTDMCGFDADGTDNPTIDDYDANWRISIHGDATLKTVQTGTITITSAMYVQYNGTRYKLDPVKAMSLGLFVKA